MVKTRVEAARPYDVLTGEGLLSDAADLIGIVAATKKIAVVTDDTVDSLYGAGLVKTLEDGGFSVSKFVFPHGEASKNTDTYVKILGFLADNGFGRDDTVAALGGGVVGDVAGFAAATYMRGMKYVQIPTTLLSAVDSSVGGKCAVDLPQGKNLAGAFHQPSLVICDTKTLDTLPAEYYLDGCGEVLKYGILTGGRLLAHLIEKGASFDREYVIPECVKYKAEVVAEDEFDHGRRALLNLGHTTAHAIEKLSEYKVSHGAAVAVGCAVAARASAFAGFCTEGTVQTVENAVRAFGLEDKTEYTASELYGAMISDKKRRGEVMDFVTVRAPGDVTVTGIPLSRLEKFVSHGI